MKFAYNLVMRFITVPLLLVAFAALAVTFACSERKAFCFDKNSYGDCHDLCTDGDNGACDKLQAMALKDCIQGEDVARCDHLCTFKVPNHHLYCDRVKQLCAQDQHKASEGCTLYQTQ